VKKKRQKAKVKRQKYKKGHRQAQRHSSERLVDVEETAIGSRMLQRSAKKWRGMAREPASKSSKFEVEETARGRRSDIP
jgi:hypothetical protein